VVTRWLHIYVSMFAFTVVLFFSVTGLTLNHADWFFGGYERHVPAEGELDLRWLIVAPEDGGGENGDASDGAGSLARLEVVEHLRRVHGVRGALSEFSADQTQCVVVFKGPGYSADAFIDRQTGKYQVMQTWHGLVAVLNDLHKGRDTGAVWSWVIDVSAILTAFISITGLILLLYIKRRRAPGLILAVVGTVVVIALFRFWVP